MVPYYNNYFWFYPFLPPNNNLPPTVYTILETIVNPDVDLNEPAPDIKIKDLAKVGRSTIFNFDYPLSNKVNKEKFECMILNHFLRRRIGFETVTAFRIQLDVKLNEIMPFYNKMFDALENWDIFDGETMERTGKDDRKTENKNNTKNNTKNNLTNHSTTTTNDTSDRRNSELPQSRLEDVRNGSYVTNYSYDTNNNNSEDNSNSEGTSEGTSEETNNGTDINEYNETIKRTATDKIAILKEMQENVNNIYTMIFKDLDCLFYQLV